MADDHSTTVSQNAEFLAAFPGHPHAFREGAVAFSQHRRVEDNPYPTESLTKHRDWASGWIAARDFARTQFLPRAIRKPFYLPKRYKTVRWILAVVTFLYTWIFLIAILGPPVGIALGWIPSLIIACLVFLWPLLFVGLVLYLFLMLLLQK